MEIKENITIRNYTKGNNRIIKYIVIHYVGAVSTAKNNSDYFKSIYRGASAHYFVDDNEIYRVVKDTDIAWHCGTNGKYYNECRNSNSIGIEMCCYNNNGVLDISDNIVNKTIELTKELMAKYNIPESNVIRHYDVTHKNCPAPFVSNENRWNEFKSKLTNTNIDSSTTQTPNNTTSYLVKVTASVLNVRSGPGTNYGINTTVKKDEVYTIVEENNGWGKLKSGAGWISLSYTTKNTEANSTPSNSNKYVLGLYVVTASALNVRSGPGTSNLIKKAYKKGTRFDTYEIKNNWARTPSGWVCLDYCNLIKQY